MKTLYLEGTFGACGNMLIGSLLAHTDENTFHQCLSGLSLTNEFTISCQKQRRYGIQGNHIQVVCKRDVQTRGLDDIIKIIQDSSLSQPVKANATAVFQRLAQAEAAVHGVPVSQIHFHEVGGIDCMVDIVSTCILMELIAPDRVIVSTLNVGSGTVECAHGLLPVPAPAVAQLLTGIPVTSRFGQGERVTPTGAALITHFATEYGQLPEGKIQSTGYGFGDGEYPEGNYLRSFLLEGGQQTDWVYQLICTIDDMTSESLACACEQLLKAGALDVCQQPVMMKKGRCGTLLTLLCKEKDKFCQLLFQQTTTLGIRVQHIPRVLRGESVFETLHTAYGPVRVKHTGDIAKPEYEDIRKAAENAGSSFEHIVKSVWEEKYGR